MSESAAPSPATPRLAATILMLRDGTQGLEVFMVVRHQQIDFASGALVFPGGKLAAGDGEPALRARCRGADTLSDDDLALRVGAIREAFEESGLLLALDRASGAALDADRVAALGERYRRALDKAEIGMAAMLEAEDLVLDVAALTPFAHWITPGFMPKRFDTWFYLACAPAGQAGLHDGHEAVDSAWLNPQVAIDDVSAGRRVMVPATLLNVQKLGRSQSVAEAFAAARADRIVAVEPVVAESTGKTRTLRIPAEAGYGVTEFSF